MKGLIILILLGVLYKIFPENLSYHFPFSDREGTWQFVSFAILLRLMIFYFAWELSKHKEGFEYHFLRCFACVTLGKTIDFALNGNTPYFGIEWLTFNTVSIFILIAYECSRQWKSSLSHGLY